MSIYRIQAYRGTGLFLNVYGTGTITGRRNVCIWSETTSSDQKWSITSLGNNVLVKSMNNQNYALNAKTDTWNCDVMTVNTDSYVNFQAVNKNEKLYRIQLVSNTAKYLTAEGTAKNSNVAWAALNTSSDAQVWKVFEEDGDIPVTPPTPSGSIQTLIATAKACLGKNLAECATYFGVSNPGVAWCAWFVRQCGAKAGMFFGNSNVASQLTGIDGNFAFSQSGVKVGDLAFIDPNGGTKIGHVGIIVEINSTQIVTVEGNMSGTTQTSIVKNGKYNLSGYSSGFGRIVKYGKNS